MMSTMRNRTLPAEQAQQQQEQYEHHFLEEQPAAPPLLLPSSSSSIQKQTEYHDTTTLPSCEELMQHPNSPYADGAFLTRRSTHVQWKLRSDHSRELVLPNTCILKRYTSIEAKTCLRDKHIMFVGDSLSRYQYLSLAYFLEYDQWSKRFIAGFPSSFCNSTRSSSAIGGTTLEKDAAETTETSCSTRSEPNVCSEIEWGAWPPFQQNLGGGDDGGVFHGRMEAWSTRGCKYEGENMQYVTAGDPILVTNSGGSISEVNHTDNSNNNNHNWKGRTKVSFTFEAGWDEVGMFSSGWNYTGCALDGTCRYTQQQYENNIKRCDEENDVEMDWHYPSIIEGFGGNSSSNSEENSTMTVFREQYAGVNYVFYNRGLWGHIPEQKANKMMSLLHDFVTPRDHIDSINNNPKNRCFFKSTTACGRTHDGGHNDHEFGKVRKAAILAGCEYMDVAHLTLEFAPLIHSGDVTSEYMTIFTDTVHYQPWVYEELNNVMLNVLCNAG